MSNCDKCIHLDVCYQSAMKMCKMGKARCRYYRGRADIVYKLIKIICFIQVLMTIKIKECHHLCFRCEHKERCHSMIKEEIRQI